MTEHIITLQQIHSFLHSKSLTMSTQKYTIRAYIISLIFFFDLCNYKTVGDKNVKSAQIILF